MSEPLYPSFRFTPKHLSDITSWHPHMPFGYDLISALAPKILVELGVHYGDSFFTFCQARKNLGIETICYGVDTWEGDYHSGEYGEEVFEYVSSYNESNYSDFSYLIRSTFAETVKKFEDDSIDLLHIDGLHTYEAVSEDFHSWWPKVSIGGIVLLHDVAERQGDFGVWKFWNEIKGDYPHFFFRHGHGLGVIQKKKKNREVIRFGNTNLDPEHQEMICRGYVAAHELILCQIKARERLEALNNESEKIKTLASELKLETKIRINKEKDLAKEKESREVKEAELAQEKESREAKETELAQEKEILLVVEAELIERKDKIRRMQNSFSWKVTGPLRFLRQLRNSLLNDRVRQQDKVKSSVVHRETPLTPSIMEPLSAFEFPSTHTEGKTISEQEMSDRQIGMTLHWLIPDFGIGSGGHTTIFRMISWLEQFGHVNYLWICGGTQYGTAEKARRIIVRHFFPLNAKVNLLLRPEETELIGDGLICTSYDTCYYARATPFAGERFYFVQDHESEFAATGSHHFLAAETYKFGLHCITAGKWLAEKVTSVGGSVVGRFDLAVDRKLFFENSNKALSPIPRIAAYARSGTPRRLTELTIFALNILVRGGLSFEVEFFGDRTLPVPAAFPHRIRGVLEPAALGDLYRTCDLGCVFSATNYSLVPLEMMACGLPVVEFDGENTRKTYPENAVAFAKPTPEAIAETIRTLLGDRDLQSLHIAAGRAFVQELSWEKSARQMETALSQTLGLPILEK